MKAQEQSFTYFANQTADVTFTNTVENSIARSHSMSPAMLVFMLSAAMMGICLGYHLTQNVFASLVFGGVLGRIGMWGGMISCTLVAGIEDFLQNIFK